MVGVEPEAVEAEGAGSVPGVSLAIVERLDVSHGAHQLDSPLLFRQALFRACRRSELWGGGKRVTGGARGWVTRRRVTLTGTGHSSSTRLLDLPRTLYHSLS